ncbi:MAG TPA: cytochrome b [Hyphomonadaceae bacterium]|uniref:cytochrome b n=1 Tax=Ponticaulis sp. TaxID=2020902 RepID=UPI000E8158F5|nr:cytochrome b N-terminal domain-containing protein [Ponticaulis sp.]MDF1679185.1 cytochrome b N-terminal domain-containing protein [Ponticaulis sp.]HBH88497.1 cytochrome b [Hyphomonadaceae bacterium]HBJ94723.1 cytochrome b [Hyphomonadaceae bacterium]|tara:strand:- start:22665 stop:24155 length:1491 start_codon:yes stop_codon:yes gene_type:complete
MSGHESTYKPGTGIEKWIDARLPIVRLVHDSFVGFPVAKNLNYWWTFGAILAVCLVTQIITGIVLAMHYVPHVDMAFASVERIMRDVEYGWLIRYIHANGASMFFLAVYIHMFRGLYYGSYKAPREISWILGVIIYLLMMGTAFMGYVLPWGQMSLHGASVITNLIGAIPLVGEQIKIWLQGAPSIGNATLNRFFSLHYLLPFMIAGVVILHIWAFHTTGNNNPTGVDVKDEKKDTVPFHPYYTVKDGFAIIVFLMIFAGFVFYAPNVLGHADNYIEGNPLKTPAHIVPEWYLLPFYAILRAITFDIGPIPAKLGGVIAMFGAIAVLFVLPWLDTSKVRSLRYRPLARQFFLGFVAVCLLLGVAGASNPDDIVIKTGEDTLRYEVALEEAPEAVAVAEAHHGKIVSSNSERVIVDFAHYEDAVEFAEASGTTAEATVKHHGLTWLPVAQLLTFLYFAYFLIIIPLLGLIERPKDEPESIADSIHKSNGSADAVAAE